MGTGYCDCARLLKPVRVARFSSVPKLVYEQIVLARTCLALQGVLGVGCVEDGGGGRTDGVV